MRRLIALVFASTALAACGGGGGGSSSASGAAAPAASSADQPWTTASQPGLWRHVETRDGVAGEAELVCYTPGMGSLAAAPVAGWRCDAGRPTDTADGYVLAQRCTAPDGRAQDLRSVVTGDLAAAFNVTTALPGGGSVVSTWMRMGSCPDGMAPGQRRADAYMAAPPPPPLEPRRPAAPAAPAAAPADPIGDVLAGDAEPAAPAPDTSAAPAATDPAAKPD